MGPESFSYRSLLETAATCATATISCADHLSTCVSGTSPPCSEPAGMFTTDAEGFMLLWRIIQKLVGEAKHRKKKTFSLLDHIPILKPKPNLIPHCHRIHKQIIVCSFVPAVVLLTHPAMKRMMTTTKTKTTTTTMTEIWYPCYTSFKLTRIFLPHIPTFP